MPRATIKPSSEPQRHDPLYAELDEDARLAKYGKVAKSPKNKSSKKKRKGKDSDDDDADELLDVKSSKRIFELAKTQQEELAVQDGDATDEDEDEERIKRKKSGQFKDMMFAMRSKPTFGEEDEEEMDEGDVEDGDGFADEEYEELEIDPEDMNTLDALLPPNSGARKTLADMIFEKFESGDIEVGKTVKVDAPKDGPPDPTAGVDPKVVAVYVKVGQLLNRYRSGPLPKPFKILPALPGWARLLAITNPEMWTPHAFNACTRILISNLKPEQAKVYLEGVLLPAVRENIRANAGKLNVQLYEAVKRSVYKPAAFFKGILFPLCEGGCTLKEAAILASIISKVSIPNLHSAAAILRLASMDYAGPNSLFIRILLDKKYALPYKVVDGVVFHFIRLANTYKGSRTDGDKLPVLWHQSLLVFVQRYSSDLTPDQKDALLDVIRARPHAQIGPEVRREIVNSVARGEARPTDGDIEMK